MYKHVGLHCRFLSLPHLVFLTLCCISSMPRCGSASTNFSLHAALLSRFHTSDEENAQRESSRLTDAQLISGLDLLLNSTAQYQAFNFTGVYELEGDTALRIIHSCQQAAAAQLSPAAFLLWMQQTEQSLLHLPGDECQPLMRRFIIATIVKQWLAAGNFSEKEDSQAIALMGKVGPNSTVQSAGHVTQRQPEIDRPRR